MHVLYRPQHILIGNRYNVREPRYFENCGWVSEVDRNSIKHDTWRNGQLQFCKPCDAVIYTPCCKRTVRLGRPGFWRSHCWLEWYIKRYVDQVLYLHIYMTETGIGRLDLQWSKVATIWSSVGRRNSWGFKSTCFPPVLSNTLPSMAQLGASS